MYTHKRCLAIVATVVALLATHSGSGTVAAQAAASHGQTLGLTVWSASGASALDGVGSIVAVAEVPSPLPGQATENRWSIAHAFYFLGDSRPFGMISLDTDGAERYATIALNTGSSVAGVRRLAFPWQAGKLYLPLAVVSGSAVHGFVHDFDARTWTYIGSVPLPGSYGRLTAASTTFLWWYGADQPDCASIPRVDHYRNGPLGVVNGNPQSIPSTAVTDDVIGSDCPATTTTDPNPSWRRYSAGSHRAPVVDWATANHNDANTRESPLSAIHSQNIAELTPGWGVAGTGSGFYGAFGGMNPVVVDGTAYFQDLRSNVYAVDAATGAPRWRREYNADNIGPNGPAVREGRVFVTTSMNRVAALDAGTGRELWSTTIANSDTQGITTQISAAGGTVYFSTVPAPSVTNFYPPGGMGILYALDERTGGQKWSFNTVKDGDLWGHPEINSGGGSWYPPAIDVASGPTYWATGNPAPFPGTPSFPNGSSRPGPNLYTNSMLAIDGSGNLEWYRQITPHDLFDYDFEAPPILTTATIDGVARNLVLGAGKAGRVVAFDAEVGDIVWNVKVGVHHNDELTSIPTGATVDVSPGFVGGVMSPMALSGGILYVPVANTHARYTSSTTSVPPGGSGELVALHVGTGQVAWKADLDSPVYAGATVVRDLVITATLDGDVVAFDRASGRRIWAWRAQGGINSPIAVTGDSLLVPVGMGPSPMVVGLRLTA